MIVQTLKEKHYQQLHQEMMMNAQKNPLEAFYTCHYDRQRRGVCC